MALRDFPFTVHLRVKDADLVSRALQNMGAEGARALKRLEAAQRQAAFEASALGRATQAGSREFGVYANRAGPIGRILAAIGPAGVIAGAGVGLLTTALATGTRAASSTEAQLLKIEGVLKATGQASGQTREQIAELAAGISRSTLATSSEVREAAAALLSFRSIAGDTFERTLRLSQDLAALGFGGLMTSATQLGRVLEDPVKGLDTLRRFGISFSAQQREVIETLAETGRVAEAQAFILDRLSEKVAGAGEAEAGGLAGAFHLLKENVGDFLEEVARRSGTVSFLTELLTALANAAELAEGAIARAAPGQRLTEAAAALAGQGTRVQSIQQQLEQAGLDPTIRRELIEQLDAELARMAKLGIAYEEAAHDVRELESAQKSAADASAEAARRATEEAAAEQAREAARERAGRIALALKRSLQENDRARSSLLRTVESAERAAALAGLEGEAKLKLERDLSLKQLEAQAAAAPKLQELAARGRLAIEQQFNRDLAALRQKAAEEALREAEQLAREQARPFQQAAEEIQRGFSDALFNVFSGRGNRSLVEDFIGFVRDAFARLLAELATLALIRPIVVPVVSAVAGGLGLSGLAQTALTKQLSGGGLLGGAGNLLGAGSALARLSGGIRGFLQTPLIGSVVGPLGPQLPALTLGGLLGAGALGAFGGGLLAQLTGGNQLGGTIGGGLGAAGGALIGSIFPGVGTLLGGLIGGAGGGLLGSLFGGGKRPRDFSVVRFDFMNGVARTLFEEAKKGGDLAAARSFADMLAQLFGSIAQTSGASLSGRNLVAGIHQGRFFAGLQQPGGPPSFASAEQATLNAIREALAGGVFRGLPDELARVLRRSTRLRDDPQEILADLQVAMIATGQTADVLAAEIDAINAKWREAIRRARELGLATERLEAARQNELDLLRERQRAPFVQAAGSIVDFLRAQALSPTSTLSPLDRLGEAQRQFGDLLSAVRGGNLGLIGSLTGAAGTLIQLGRETFASTVDFANIERFVRESLTNLASEIVSESFIDRQIQATRDGTAAIVSELQALRDQNRRIERELVLLRRELAA